jgi:curved DNA-binding protein CbpA
VATRTHFEIMMLHPSATPEVITAVYRQLAKQHHPDHAGPDGERRMAEINEAFAILGNPEKRSRYDELIGLGGDGADATDGAATGAASRPTAASGSTHTRSAGVGAATGTSGTAAGTPGTATGASSGAAAASRPSAPGATNLKYEAGGWSIREPWETTPPPPQYGEAGPPPRNLPAKGRAISFGRYRGWTVSQVASYDRNYIEWLARTMAGRMYQAELEQVLSKAPAR